MTDNIPPPRALKQLIKKFIPDIILQVRRDYIISRKRKEFKDLSVKDCFTKIYTEGHWGKLIDPKDKFFSGSGSNDLNIVSTYINAIEKFLTSFDKKPNVVDLGCGDFSVGSKIRHLCENYIACDIVEPLIIRNKGKYKEINVDFRVIDITADELPDGEVVFIRQVLQHLSNEQIIKVINKFHFKYKYLVLTEHLPLSVTFTPNIDNQTGPNIRLKIVKGGSGVVLTSPPFNLQVKENKVLCNAIELDGLIQTNLYRLV